MHGDFSRLTFDARNHFSTVLLQQGRVSLDADANEQAAITQHYVRTLAADLFGRHAWPRADAGFAVELVADAGTPALVLGPGRCYVDGILVENPEPATYTDQPADGPRRDPPYFVYLEVWERLITFVEQPEIRDVALGLDTSVRTKVVWRARVSGPLTDSAGPPPGGDDRAASLAYWTQRVEPGLGVRGTGALAADVQAAAGDTSARSGYQGVDNQLYRVEIHTAGVLGDAGGPPPTFKWSRENGSVVLPIARRSENVLVLGQLGRDDRHGLHVDDWVELSDDASVLSNAGPATLRRVAGIDAGASQVTLDAAPDAATGSDPTGHPLLRRWDQRPAAGEQGADGAIRVGAAPVSLERGIEVTFQPGRYRAGDYWLIPARVATADIEWPRSPAPVARSAAGVEHSYVPIAYVTRANDVQDLRLFVEPLAR